MITKVDKELMVDQNYGQFDFEMLDMGKLIEAASKTIVPLGPLTNFAARHPWVGLEEQSFEQVARKLNDSCDIKIYPNEFILKSAWNRGEISSEFLETRLQNWLKKQSFELPTEIINQYCRAALFQEEKDLSQLPDSELKRIAQELKHLNVKFPRKYKIQTYSQLLEKHDGKKLTKILDSFMIKWCKLFLDETQAVWSMPNREYGFYQAWKSLIQYDPAVNRSVRKRLIDLPTDPSQALMESLLGLEISHSDVQGYLEAHLLSLPGWAGMMLWRSQQSTKEKNLLLEFLAVRICTEYALIKPYFPLTITEDKVKEDTKILKSIMISWANWGNFPINEWLKLSPKEVKARLTLAFRFDQIVRQRLWLEAWEQTYERQLREILISPRKSSEERKQALAQFAFCIDVRSEPFRRKLEQAGLFETFGTAGFFGLPIETCKLGSHRSHESLPVMFKPQYRVKEMSTEIDLISYIQRQQAAKSVTHTFETLKHNLSSSLLLPEISGPWLSLKTLLNSFVPRSAGYIFRKIKDTWLYKPTTQLSLDRVQSLKTELPIGFSNDEKVYYVRQALKMMGLTENFAPLVVICGHGSCSTNNPFASSLDCGACGGASSGFNARVLATLCNLPEVRHALSKEGIKIPTETVFVAAEHITTQDEVQWLYVPELSRKAREAFDYIQSILPKISEQANMERISKLPNIAHCKNNKNEAQRLSQDWSEVRPEWGLARNASFIIGTRTLTEDCDLDGRAFLHNYNWQKDQNGELLSNIISGPATVAQWINLQYFASTVAPHYYGSGNKTTQTVTGGIGVMQGNASDLLSGLPWQSVMKSDHEAYHDPLRLLVVIEAPKEYIKRLLNQNQSFLQKVQNGWIRLASIDPNGNWESW